MSRYDLILGIFVNVNRNGSHNSVITDTVHKILHFLVINDLKGMILKRFELSDREHKHLWRLGRLLVGIFGRVGENAQNVSCDLLVGLYVVIVVCHDNNSFRL